jgi:hypothetical protein
MKNLIGFLLLCLCTQLYAGGVDTVRILNPTTLSVTGHTIKDFILGSGIPAGDKTATTEASPEFVYVPIARVTSAPATVFDNQPYFLLYNTEGITELFDIASPTQYISFPVVVTTGTTANYLYAAVKSGTNYYVISKFASSLSNLSNNIVYFNISLKEICDQIIAAGGTECSLLGRASGVEVNPAPAVNLYFFQAAASTGLTVPGNIITPADAAYSGGIYFQVQMSNRVYQDTELELTLDPIRVGDGRLLLNVTTSAQMTDFLKMMVYQQGAIASPGARLPVGSSAGGSFIDLGLVSQGGEITINKLSDGSPLLNNTTYHFSAVLVDKFKFASTMPDVESGTPLQIEQLLKKQACFLLTAGFGQEHYIISYFRNFRDNVLLKNWLGQKFVDLYYKSAPKYALIIYKSELLRAGIRILAYIAYFIFRNFKFLTMSLVLITLFIVSIRVKNGKRKKEFKSTSC